MKIALRIRKIKSNATAATQIHNQRKTNDSAANLRRIDSSRTHLNIDKYYTKHGSDISAAADDLIAQNVKRKVRDNAIKQVELVLQPGVGWYDIDSNTPEKFFKHTEQVLKQKFGQNLLSINMHCDENGGAHCHCIVVPITEDCRLSAKDIFGNNVSDKKYVDWQNWAGQAYSGLGLERGDKFSAAKHTTIKQYQTIVKTSAKRANELNADLSRVDAIKQLAVAQTTTEQLKKENERMKRSSEYYKQKYYEEQRKAFEMQNEQARNISVREVVEYMYSGSKVAHDKNKYKVDDVTVSVNDAQNSFKVWQNGERGGRGAISLVMQLSKLSFKDAIAKLAKFFDSDNLANEIVRSETVKKAAESTAKEALTAKNLDAVELTEQAREHLRKTRGLSRDAIRFLEANGLRCYKSGKFTNLVYFSKDDKSAEISGIVKIDNKRFKKNIGDDAVIINAFAKRAVVAESVLDAISYCLCNNIDYTQTALISTSGNSKLQQAMQSLKNYESITIATDNDAAGNAIAEKIQQHFKADRALSVNKDFNADLTDQSLKAKRENVVSVSSSNSKKFKFDDLERKTIEETEAQKVEDVQSDVQSFRQLKVKL